MQAKDAASRGALEKVASEHAAVVADLEQRGAAAAAATAAEQARLSADLEATRRAAKQAAAHADAAKEAAAAEHRALEEAKVRSNNPSTHSPARSR